MLGKFFKRVQDPRVPPNQSVTQGFPVLTYGPTPRVKQEDYELKVFGLAVETTFRWEDLMAMPQTTITKDFHCVTHWSRLDMAWRGVSLDKIFENVESEHEFVMAHSYGGYTTNIPLEDLLDGRAWIATEADGGPLDPEHGGPARLLVPHLYFWKSAKWVRGLTMMPDNDPGFWEQYGYHIRGDPWKEERYS
jgi:DMSO/TMAO reductase YedYZ molybdopterin-dependent catalytic subunit